MLCLGGHKQIYLPTRNQVVAPILGQEIATVSSNLSWKFPEKVNSWQGDRGTFPAHLTG
jgi:hypothetical protein